MTSSDRLAVPSEVQEVYQFLQQHTPFADLPADKLLRAARQLVVTYCRAATDVELAKDGARDLYIVRSGAIAVFDADQQLLDKVDVGRYFRLPPDPEQATGRRFSVLEDSLLYRLDEATFQWLREQDEAFALFFNRYHTERLQTVLRQRPQHEIYGQQVRQMLSGDLISVTQDASVLQAAQLMTERGISSVAVVGEGGQLLGIMTDRDLRKRVIARQQSPELSVTEIMTPDPVTVDAEALVDQAILAMVQHNVHHLPVLDNDQPTGMLTMTDLIRLQKTEPVLLMSAIHKAETVQELVAASETIKHMVFKLISSDVRAEVLGRLLTMITDTLTVRLINLAQQQLGVEPVPFVWLAFGSQGRQDQSAKSDQDNGLLLHDTVTAEHDEYFKSLADFVCDGLNACGYIYCPGDVMASNRQWRQSLQQWQSAFSNWILQPEPKALMHASIFFDMRPVYRSDGSSGMFSQLQQKVLGMAQRDIFLACMTINALELTPPLGFFNRLVVERSGEHKDTLDIKLRGLLPLTDIGRIQALANGVQSVNTIERFNQLREDGHLSEAQVNNLLDAQEFIAQLRLEHQGQQMAAGRKPDNHLQPDQLSALVKHQLKDAFQIVVDAQRTLRNSFARDLG